MVEVVPIDVSSTDINFEEFMQAGCRDQAQKDVGDRSEACKKWYSRVTYSIRH